PRGDGCRHMTCEPAGPSGARQGVPWREETYRWPGGNLLALSLVVSVEEGGRRPCSAAIPVPSPSTRWGSPSGRSSQPRERVELPLRHHRRLRPGDRSPERRRLPGDLDGGSCGSGARPVGVVHYIRSRSDEVASHAHRWIRQFRMDESEVREFLRRTAASLTATAGARPVGYLSRYLFTEQTRRILAGGRLPLPHGRLFGGRPFWDVTAGPPIVIVPYAIDTNDIKMWAEPSYTPNQRLEYAIDTFERLFLEGADRPA
ncbi:MAG: hypothetical protein ACRD6W_07455, partial [Nitrososphaerales archaeon]